MKKILVAYDGGEPAQRAIELAADLAQRFDAKVGVVSVVPVHGGRAPIDPWDDRAVHTTALAEAKTILSGYGIKPDLFEPSGDPAKTIEEVAEDGGYDMIVVGSRGQGTLARFLQGSVSEHIATHSGATVVVAR
jgi:nucleotide-binding universal stress UspA family protein